MNKKIVTCKWIFFTLMLVVNAFIIYQSCLPKASSRNWSDAVIDVIKVITDGSVDSSTPITPNMSWGSFIRKAIGHFGLFAIDGVVTFLYFHFLYLDKKFTNRNLYIYIAAVLGIIVAVVTELLQLVIPGRYGDVIDILIDIGGYVVGVVITFFIVYLVNRQKNKKELIKEN